MSGSTRRRFKERRRRPDRRSRPTPLASRHSFRGRRRHQRRREDRRQNHYVDRFAGRYLLLVGAVIILSVVDAVFTLKLIKAGLAVEANPVMDYFLGLGVSEFLIVKFSLTALCILLLIAHKNFRIFGGRVPVLKVAQSVVLVYIFLIIYELVIFKNGFAG